MWNTVQAMTAGHIDILTADGCFGSVQGAKSIHGQEPDGTRRRIHVYDVSDEPIEACSIVVEDRQTKDTRGFILRYRRAQYM